MTFQPAVTVVIPAYNAQTTLRGCLDSVCASTFPETQMQILVVDNNSNDSTPSILASYAPRVQSLQEKKRGRAVARNCGITHAQGEIIAFTDSDCIVEREWLAHLIEPFADENVGIVGGAIRSVQPSNAIEQFGEQIHDQARAIRLYRPAYVSTGNCAIPRRLLTALGMYNEQFERGEDTDLTWRILQAGKQVVYQGNAVVYHRNASTLRGLFVQGFRHGYHSVVVNRAHRSFLQQFGYRRFDRPSYLRLFASLREYLTTHSNNALYAFTFNGAKKLGKVCGSARAGYLDL